MRIPDALFPLVNRMMRVLLRSPLHGLFSASVMAIHYRGRRTGLPRCTPVRYLRRGAGEVIALTGRETGWWPNFLAPATVRLRLAGRLIDATAHALPDDDAGIEAALRQMLERFPSDAPYHGIELRRGATPDAAQLRSAVRRDVLVVFAIHGEEN